MNSDRSFLETIEFDVIPAEDVPEEDRNAVLQVAKVMLTLHHPRVRCESWFVKTDAGETGRYEVVVRWPARTMFSLNQLALVELVNSIRVEDVWVQSESDHVLLCASYRGATLAPLLVRQEIRIVTAKLGQPDGKKRKMR